MSRLFWLSDEAWAAIEPQLPTNQPGARRVDDRRVISGILHVIRSGCLEGTFRPSRRQIGRSRGGQTTKIHALTDVLGRPVTLTLSGGNVADIRMAETLLAHSQPMRRLIADRGYDANALRQRLRQTGAKPVIPGRRSLIPVGCGRRR